MATQFSTTTREFSPAEAEHMTGLPVAGQRDWRRRGLLPATAKGKWTKFSLEDVIRIAVLRAFSEAGFAVSAASDGAALAVLPTLRALYADSDAVTFVGDHVSDALKMCVLENSVVGVGGRYVVLYRDCHGSDEVRRCHSLDDVDKLISEAATFMFTAIDCDMLAVILSLRADGPLIEVSAKNT